MGKYLKKHIKRRSASLINREMQIKTIRYHFTSTKRTNMKRAENNKCWEECGEIYILETASGSVK